MDSQNAGGGTPVSDRFLQLVLEADALVDAANEATLGLGEEATRPQVWRTDVSYAAEALAGATMSLGAAANSYQALRLLTFPQGLIAKDGRVLAATITVNGTAGLLRQSVECGVVAEWLLQPTSDREHEERGFAFMWKDAREHLAYARSLRNGPVNALERVQESLIDDGRTRDLLVQQSRSPGWKPRKPVPGASGLLAGAKFPVSYFDGLTDEERAPIGSDGEWLYRWLSGMAHGLNWVHPAPQRGSSESTALINTEPLYLPLMLSADLAVRLIQRVTRALVDRASVGA